MARRTARSTPIRLKPPRPQVADLQAAKDDPDDPTPRLILADWLEEHGNNRDTILARLVRLQGQVEQQLHQHPAGRTIRDCWRFGGWPLLRAGGELRQLLLSAQPELAARIGGTYHYAQLGMADGRNARPTKQWELLHVLARNHGVLTWKSSDAGRKNKKRRELLARDLKAFFRLGGEPILLTDDGKGWQTIFALCADA